MEVHIWLMDGQVLAIMVRVVVLVVELVLTLDLLPLREYGQQLEVALLAKGIVVDDLVMITAILIIQEILVAAVALEQLVLVAVIPIPLPMEALVLNIPYRELLLITPVAVAVVLRYMMDGQVLVLAMVGLVEAEMVAVVTEQQILAVAVAVGIKVKTAVPAAAA